MIQNSIYTQWETHWNMAAWMMNHFVNFSQGSLTISEHEATDNWTTKKLIVLRRTRRHMWVGEWRQLYFIGGLKCVVSCHSALKGTSVIMSIAEGDSILYYPIFSFRPIWNVGRSGNSSKRARVIASFTEDFLIGLDTRKNWSPPIYDFQEVCVPFN